MRIVQKENVTAPHYNYIDQTPKFGPGCVPITTSQNVQNGRFTFAAINSDQYNLDSYPSTPKENVVIDTQPPIATTEQSVPKFSKDNQVAFATGSYTDNTINPIRFNYSNLINSGTQIALKTENIALGASGSSGYGNNEQTILSFKDTAQNAQIWRLTTNQEIKALNGAGRCLDSNLQTVGSSVILFDCNNTTKQKWIFIENGLIKNIGSSLCLKSENGKTQVGSRMLLATCDINDVKQQFNLNSLDSGYYPFNLTTNVASTAGYYNGTRTYVTTARNLSEQSWTYSPVTKEIRTALGFCLDGVYSQAGNIPYIWPCHGGDNQKWDLTSAGQIKQATTNLCIELNGYNSVDGAADALAVCDYSIKQRWNIEKVEVLRIKQVGSDRSMDGGNDVNANNIASFNSSNDLLGQKWTYTTAKELRIGYTSRCLDAVYSQPGNNPYLFNCHGGDNQKWNLKPLVPGTASPVQIQLVSNPAVCIDSNNSTTLGQNFILANCDVNNNNQKFEIESTFKRINPTSEISYYTQVARDSNFTDLVNSNQAWTANPNQLVGGLSVGANEVDKTYYVRVKASDKTAGTGNISAWSPTFTTVADSFKPLVKAATSTPNRFAPGTVQNIVITAQVSEKNLGNIIVQIKDENGSVVRTLNQCQLSSVGVAPAATPAPVLCNSDYLGFTYDSAKSANDPANFFQVNFTWDGKDTNGVALTSSGYVASIVATDKAGNINDNLAGSNSLIGLDGQAPKVSLSQPTNNFWTNKNNFALQGQVGVKGSGLPFETDVSSLEIQKLDLDGVATVSNGFAYQTLSYNATNNFSFTPNLDQGENRFGFRTKDSLGNTNTKTGIAPNQVDYWSLNYENNPADITSVSPSGNLTTGSNNPNSTLQFKIKDNVTTAKPFASGFNLNYSTTVAAINPAGFDVNLLQSFSGNNGTWNVIPLYKDGVNVTNSQNNPRLAGDLSCIANGTTATSEVTCSLPLKGLPDAQYLIDVRVRDKAGNQTCSYNHVEIATADRCDANVGDKIQTSDTKFIVKSRTYLDVSAPSDNSLVAATATTITGKAEKGQALTISNFNSTDINSSLDRKLVITLDPSKNNILPAEYVNSTGALMVPEGVNSGANATPVTTNVRKLSAVGNGIQITCNENIDDDNNPQTPNLDLCSFSITVNQANNYVAAGQGPGINVRTNLNKVTLTDAFANSKVKDLKILVDLYGINLESKPNQTTFSPNGDTKYDQISFATKATKIVDGSDYTQIPKSYTFEIKNAAGATVWKNSWVQVVGVPGGGVTYSTQGIATFLVPTPIVFDGKVNQAVGTNQTQAIGSWLLDGTYTYSFNLVTQDNITFTTPVQTLTAKSNLVGQTAIFSPLDNYVTSRGVINVQGQAPISTTTNQVKTTICVDAVVTGDTNNCDLSFVANVSTSGFFSSIVSLPTSVLVNGLPVNTNTFKIRAKSTDGAGNTTPDSSIINVKLNTATNILSATTTSDLSGLNSPNEIADFLAGRTNISTLKSVKIQTQVSQDVEALDIDYADYSNLNELPGTDPVTGQPNTTPTPTNKIASINNLSDTDLNWNPLQDLTIKKDQKATLTANQTGADLSTNLANKCAVTAPATSCNWNYNYPYPTNLTGGIYEIRLRAYKGGNFQDLTRSFAVNGVVPAAPALLQVQKQYTKVPCTPNPTAVPPVVCTDLKVANQVNNSYYTNNKTIKLFGASDLNTTLKLTIKNSGGAVVQTIDVSVGASGLWSQDAVLPAIDGTYSVSLASTLGTVTVASLQDNKIILDTTNPQIQWVQTKTTSAYNGLSINPWTNSSPVQFDIRTDEPVLSGNILAQDAKVIKQTFKDVPASCGTSSLTNIQNNTGVSNQCLADYYASTRLQGEFTIQTTTDEGLYNPTIQLEDLAGNRVFYSNSQYQLDKLKNNLVALNPNNSTQDDPKVLIQADWTPAVTNGDPVRGTDPLPQGYPHVPLTPRTKSLDFRLFYDITPTYKTDFNNPTSLALNPWADKQEGLAANGLAPEADRLLTDPLYYTTGPTLNPPTPQQTKPVFVTRGNTVTLTGTIEKNQRALITAVKRKTDTPSYQEVIPNILPVMNYTGCQSSNPNAVPAITDIVKQYLTVRYKDICTFTASFTMNDDGRSPDGVPNNSYNFSFIPVDLAGNTAIPANPVQDSSFQIDQALVLPRQETGQDVTSYDFKFKILNKLNDLTNITTKFEVIDTTQVSNPTTVYTYSLNDQTLIKNQYSSYAFTWNAGLLDVNNQYVVKVSFSNQSGVIGTSSTASSASVSTSSNGSQASPLQSSSSSNPFIPGTILTPPLYTIPQALSFKPYTGNILANIGSQTITVFHDTDNPKDHKVTNIGSNSYTASNPAFTSTIPDWGNPCTSSINPDGSANPACTTSYPITKDTSIVTNIQGERKADVEVKKYFTPNTVTAAATIFNPFVLQGVGPQRNGDGGISDRSMVIGAGASDETATTTVNIVTTPCYTISNSPIKNRRIGNCSDGLYKIRMRMVDSSGNNTGSQGTVNEPGYSANIDALDSWKDYVIERDTVKPVNPTLNLSLTSDKQVGEQISLRQYLGATVTGEAKTEGNIYITAVSSTGAQIFADNRYFKVPDSGVYSNSDLLLKPAICGNVKYKISVYLQDRATNRSSEISSNEVITDACPDCGGAQLQSPLHTGAKIAFPYGKSDAYSSSTGLTFHVGVDYTGIGAEYGTPIYAAAIGVVSDIGISNGQFKGLGNYVKISHGNGLDTLYGHMNATPVVAVGQQVTTNTILGYIGSTGYSTGNHLHFQVNVNGKHEDPVPYLNNKGSSNDPGNLSIRQRAIQGCVDLRGGVEPDEDGTAPTDSTDKPDIDPEDENALSKTEYEVDVKADSPKGAQLLIDLYNAYKSSDTKIQSYILEPIAEATKCNAWDVLCYANLGQRSFSRTQEVIGNTVIGIFEGIGQWGVNTYEFIKSIIDLISTALVKVYQNGFNLGKYWDDFKNALQPVVDIYEKLKDPNFSKALMLQGITQLKDYFNQSAPDFAKSQGRLMGSIAPDVVIAIFSGGTSLFAKILRIVDEVTSALPILLKGVNVVAGFIGSQILKLAGKVLVEIKNVAGKIIIAIEEVYKVIADGTTAVLNDLLALVKNASDKLGIQRLLGIVSYCASSGSSVSQAPTVNKTNNLFAAILGGVNAEAASSISVCYLINWAESHWRLRHLDIDDEGLKNRALGNSVAGIPGSRPGVWASKFDGAMESELMQYVRTILADTSNQSILQNLVEGDGKDFIYDAGKRIGYGYRTINGVLSSPTDMTKMKIVLRKKSGKIINVTMYPMP
ncbi:MAG: ricin-type beta-trefoil lectin domain protein [bacterium]